MSTWTDDMHNVSLPLAKETEVYIGSMFENMYGYKVKLYNNDYKYDFTLTTPEKEYTVEVKLDIKHAETGNIAVEYKSRGKISGIWKTLSDFHVFRIEYSDGSRDNYLVDTEELRYSIKQKRYLRIMNMKEKGSDSGNQLYLFRRDVFLSIPTVRILKDFEDSTRTQWDYWYNNEIEWDGDVVLNPFKI